MIFFLERAHRGGERERERERERESRLTAGVNFVFSGFLNDPRRDKRDSKCRWEELGAAKRTVHRTDQSRAYRRRQGFPCRLFLASQLNGRTSSAEWRQRRNNFSPCFSLLESHIFSWKVFHGFQRGQVHSRKHKLSKKCFWRWSSPWSPPAGLKCLRSCKSYSWYSSLVYTPHWALLLGVPLSSTLRLAWRFGILSTVALAGDYRQVAGGQWYYESGATQAQMNTFVNDACLQYPHGTDEDQ